MARRKAGTRVLPGAPVESRAQRFDAPESTGAAGLMNERLGYAGTRAPRHALEYAQRNPMSEHATVSGEFAPGARLWGRMEGESPAISSPMHTPVTTWDQYSRADRQRVETHARSIGLTPSKIRRNTGFLIDQANERAQAQPGVTDSRHVAPLGRDWYYDEGRNAQEAAEQEHVRSGRMIGATAAMSPTVQWESATGKKVNLNLAKKVARLTTENPTVTITRAHADHLVDAQEQDPTSYAGRNPVDWHSLVGTHNVNDLGSHELATLGSFSGRAGHVKQTDPETGEKIKTPTRTFASHGIAPIKELSFMAEARGRPNVTKALEIMRGNATTDEALSGYGTPKPRTFNDNLSAPYASPTRATVDRWAIRGAAGLQPTGRALTGGSQGTYTKADDAPVVGKMKVPKGRRGQDLPQASEEAAQQGLYAYIQHHVAGVANARGYHAQEAQAISWTQLKGQTEGFRQFGTALPHEPDFAKQEAARSGDMDEPVGHDRVRAEAASFAISRNQRAKQRNERPSVGTSDQGWLEPADFTMPERRRRR